MPKNDAELVGVPLDRVTLVPEPEKVFTAAILAQLNAHRAAHPGEKTYVMFCMPPWPKDEPRKCGCTEYDQCRQRAMVEAEAQAISAAQADGALKRAAQHFSTNGHDVSQAPPCNCSLCKGHARVRRAMTDLSLSYTAHAEQSTHDFRYRQLNIHAEHWREMARACRSPHERRGGQ